MAVFVVTDRHVDGLVHVIPSHKSVGFEQYEIFLPTIGDLKFFTSGIVPSSYKVDRVTI